MNNRLCYGCMQEVETEVCPHCGWTAQQNNERHQLPVGTVLMDKYIVGRVLGQGGFGITYLGLERNLNILVCIKEFFPHNTVNRDNSQSRFVNVNTQTMEGNYASARERFIREAKSLAKFRDVPQIVSIYELFQMNNTAYMVMEFVAGTDMVKYIHANGGRLPMNHVMQLLEPIMTALAQVHDAGLIHRDISPDNIMVQPSGYAKLLDFGAVRNVDNPDQEKMLTHSTEAIIKNGFAPMEQYASRGSLGPWTDVYAMSATIYYSITGQLLENAPTRMLEGAQLDWSNALGITQEQCAVLERGLALNIKERIPNVRQLLEELRIAANGTPLAGADGMAGQNAEQNVTESVQESVGENTGGKKESGRKKSKVGLIAALLAAVVGLGAGGWFLSGVTVEGATPSEAVLMAQMRESCSAIGYYDVSAMLSMGGNRKVSFPVGESYNGMKVTLTDDNGIAWGPVTVENGVAVVEVPADGCYLVQVRTQDTEFMNWTQWEQKLPGGVRLNQDLVEEDVQYRFREKEYKDYALDTLVGWELEGEYPSTSPYGEWSEWTEEELVSNQYTEVEQQVLYRFRNNEKTTSNTANLEGWTSIGSTKNYSFGAWSDWTESAAAASETLEVESKSQWQATWVVVHGDNVGAVSNTGWRDGGGKPAKGSQDARNNGDIVECTAVNTRTVYRTRSKIYQNTTYYYSRWTDWSDWNPQAVEAKDGETEVESKQVYRSREIFGDTVYRFWRWAEWSEWTLEVQDAGDDVSLEERIVYRYVP